MEIRVNVHMHICHGNSGRGAIVLQSFICRKVDAGRKIYNPLTRPRKLFWILLRLENEGWAALAQRNTLFVCKQNLTDETVVTLY